jgi:hypothetical protein
MFLSTQLAQHAPCLTWLAVYLHDIYTRAAEELLEILLHLPLVADSDKAKDIIAAGGIQALVNIATTGWPADGRVAESSHLFDKVIDLAQVRSNHSCEGLLRQKRCCVLCLLLGSMSAPFTWRPALQHTHPGSFCQWHLMNPSRCFLAAVVALSACTPAPATGLHAAVFTSQVPGNQPSERTPRVDGLDGHEWASPRRLAIAALAYIAKHTYYVAAMENAGFFEAEALPRMLEQSFALVE